MNFDIRGVIIAVILFAIIWILTACDSVEIRERVIYGEDDKPVQGAKVVQWTDSYRGVTKTDDNGEWTLDVPPDTVINLCIDNPRNNNIEACYEKDSLITPPINGGNEMIKD